MKTGSQIALFKVLGAGGQAIHGGTCLWPLPTKNKPGRWLEYDGEPYCCNAGLHLVANPLYWWRPKARLFLAEPDITQSVSYDGDKAAFRRVRLLTEVTPDWGLSGMFPVVRAFLAATARSLDADADISWANLSRANLSWADLVGANLAEANLSRANLAEANLADADLSRANLSWANLSGANLFRTNLSWADLSGAYRPSDAPGGWRPNAEGRLERQP